MARGLMTAMIFALPLAALAATPAQEKAFVDAYRKAYEAKDAKTLETMLYTKGADPQALGFYKMMMTSGMGSKVESITLEPLTDDEKAEAAKAMPGPGGKTYRLPLAPTRTLVIKTKQAGASETSTSTSRVHVAESEGRLVIPVPVEVK